MESRAAGNVAALDVLDSSASPPPVAVIPSYSLRLLEGCGSVAPGDLKVIGTTEPVPFITVFVSNNIAAAKKQTIVKTLLGIRGNAKLLKAMETRDGFKPIKAGDPAAPLAAVGPDWPDWRGPNRDARVPRLPSRLPETAKVIWKKAAMPGGLAGLSVSGGRLILAERDPGDANDVYRCLDAGTGELLWRIEFPARGKLDYGTSPRATPVVHNGRAYLLGAFGELRCVKIADGKLIWKRHLPREFHAELPTWGMCSTPLIVDDLLIVNPGGKKASLVALDPVTGRTRWATPGSPAAYSAFIWGEFGGRRQLVGYDKTSLGGWDVKTGARLWQLVPAVPGDFNVPTPIAADGGIVVATENNGTRFFRFDESGRIIPKPAAEFAALAPDTTTPVITGGRIFGARSGLHCLDLQKGPVWHHEDEAFGDHASLIADNERVLVLTLGGELILLDAKADACTILSRQRLFEDDADVYSHPAVVGPHLYARGGSSVLCIDLGTPPPPATLLPALLAYSKEVAGELDKISAERKKELTGIAATIASRLQTGADANLTFICTHNSRRSHMSQIWAQAAAVYYGLDKVHTYSGGTQATACNCRTVAAMRRVGFAIEDATTGENPLYLVKYSAERPPIRAYSKLYNSGSNPKRDFIALMTCSSADKSCPVVDGAIARYPIHYVDPKLCDDTPTETTAYNERCREIAREMFCIMSEVRRKWMRPRAKKELQKNRTQRPKGKSKDKRSKPLSSFFWN